MNSLLMSLISSEGGCSRCLLRFSGDVSINTYIQTPYETHSPDKSCTLCLGILNPNAYVDPISKAISASGYEYSDFKFQVTLPPILYLRQEWFQGKCKLSGISVPRLIEIKDVFKWVFSPLLSQSINAHFSLNSDFRVNLNFTCDESQAELDTFYRTFNCSKKESMLTVFKSINSERLVGLTVNPIVYNTQLLVDCSYSPLYITGNYLKLSRKLSQTPWGVEGDNEVKDSVQECMSRATEALFSSKPCILHSSGREDVDVRMLGKGRPFILEIPEAKTALSACSKIPELQEAINQNEFVKVLNLERVGKEKFEEIRMGEEHKLKVYACIVWSEKNIEVQDIERINSMGEVKVLQKTPIRVMHRRSLKVREKVVLKMHARRINQHYMELRLVTSGGTYVKEFVHSDFGRTKPSISEILGCKADILQLDVLGLGWNIQEVEDLLTTEIE